MALIYTSTSSKKRKASNLTKAQREAEENFAKMQAQWDKEFGKFARTKVKQTPALFQPKLKAPPGRETVRLPSRNTGEVPATKKETCKYTGDKMIGIATMSKSNAVPVFSKEDAVEISRMRRG